MTTTTTSTQIEPMETQHYTVKIKTPASQDSEDRAQIDESPASSASSADGGVINGETNIAVPGSSSGSQMLHARGAASGSPAENGHHDPKQRRIYLGLLAFSILNALVGLTLILIWMLHYRPVTGFGLTDKGQLSNLHVLMMYTFMISLNMYSVLIYRTHYSRPKQQLKWAHAILSGTNILMALLGVAAMYKAHLMGNLANFYSLHSWIGVLTNGFYLSQFVFGFVAFLRPGWTAHRRQQLMPWHRLAGAALLVLAGLAAITGMAELVIFQDKANAYQSFTAITFIANFAGISVILMTATSIYLLTARQYKRPALPEEMPIKR